MFPEAGLNPDEMTLNASIAATDPSCGGNSIQLKEHSLAELLKKAI